MNLKIIQASIEGEHERQQKSEQQLRSLGERYIKIVNTPWDDEPPLDKIFGGHKDWYKHPFHDLTSRRYGCFLSHKQSIMLGFCDDGHSLICEADCKILDVEKFEIRLQEGVDLFNKSDHPILRFEPSYKCPHCPCYSNGGVLTHNPTKFYDQVADNIFECDKIIGGHCYLINEKSKSLFERLFDIVGWHAWDWWLNIVFAKDVNYVDSGVFLRPDVDGLEEFRQLQADGKIKNMLAFKEKMTGQFDGFSENDKMYKENLFVD